jgi:hypothetical protein
LSKINKKIEVGARGDLKLVGLSTDVHCSITLENDKLYLMVNSTQELTTRLNENNIVAHQKYRLKAGDTISIDNFEDKIYINKVQTAIANKKGFGFEVSNLNI